MTRDADSLKCVEGIYENDDSSRSSAAYGGKFIMLGTIKRWENVPNGDQWPLQHEHERNTSPVQARHYFCSKSLVGAVPYRNTR
jgi:hypothetical protein